MPTSLQTINFLLFEKGRDTGTTLKKYIRSLIFLSVVMVLNYFHPLVERTITRWTGRNFAIYLVYGIFAACFVVVLFRSKIFVNRKARDIALLLLCVGLVFFFLLSHPLFLFKLTMLEMFLVGIFLYWDGKSTKSLFPFLLLIAAATLVELAASLGSNGHFYIYDAWRNSIAALIGFLTASLPDG